MKVIVTAVVAYALGIAFIYGLMTTFEFYTAQNTEVLSSDLRAFKGIVENSDDLNKTITIRVARNNLRQTPTKVRVEYDSDTTWTQTDALVRDGYFFGVQDNRPIQPSNFSLGDQIYLVQNSDKNTQIRATYITILNTSL